MTGQGGVGGTVRDESRSRQRSRLWEKAWMLKRHPGSLQILSSSHHRPHGPYTPGSMTGASFSTTKDPPTFLCSWVDVARVRSHSCVVQQNPKLATHSVDWPWVCSTAGRIFLHSNLSTHFSFSKKKNVSNFWAAIFPLQNGSIWNVQKGRRCLRKWRGWRDGSVSLVLYKLEDLNPRKSQAWSLMLVISVLGKQRQVDAWSSLASQCGLIV